MPCADTGEISLTNSEAAAAAVVVEMSIFGPMTHSRVFQDLLNSKSGPTYRKGMTSVKAWVLVIDGLKCTQWRTEQAAVLTWTRGSLWRATWVTLSPWQPQNPPQEPVGCLKKERTENSGKNLQDSHFSYMCQGKCVNSSRMALDKRKTLKSKHYLRQYLNIFVWTVTPHRGKWCTQLQRHKPVRLQLGWAPAIARDPV